MDGGPDAPEVRIMACPMHSMAGLPLDHADHVRTITVISESQYKSMQVGQWTFRLASAFLRYIYSVHLLAVMSSELSTHLLCRPLIQ